MDITITFLSHMVTFTQTMLYLGLMGLTTFMGAVFMFRNIKQVHESTQLFLKNKGETKLPDGVFSGYGWIYSTVFYAITAILFGVGVWGMDLISFLQGLVVIVLSFTAQAALQGTGGLLKRGWKWLSLKFAPLRRLRMLSVRGAVRRGIEQIRKAAPEAGMVAGSISDRIEWLVGTCLPSYIEDEAKLAVAVHELSKIVKRYEGDDSEYAVKIRAEYEAVKAKYEQRVAQIRSTPAFLDYILAGIFASSVDEGRMDELKAKLDSMAEEFEEDRASKRKAERSLDDALARTAAEAKRRAGQQATAA